MSDNLFILALIKFKRLWTMAVSLGGKSLKVQSLLGFFDVLDYLFVDFSDLAAGVYSQ